MFFSTNSDVNLLWAPWCLKIEKLDRERESLDLLIGLSAGAANTKEVLIAGEIALTTLGANKNGNYMGKSFILQYLLLWFSLATGVFTQV